MFTLIVCMSIFASLSFIKRFVEIAFDKRYNAACDQTVKKDQAKASQPHLKSLDWSHLWAVSGQRGFPVSSYVTENLLCFTSHDHVSPRCATTCSCRKKIPTVSITSNEDCPVTVIFYFSYGVPDDLAQSDRNVTPLVAKQHPSSLLMRTPTSMERPLLFPPSPCFSCLDEGVSPVMVFHFCCIPFVHDRQYI